MKRWIFFFLFMVLLPCAMWAQATDVALQKVSIALSEGQTGQVVGLFKQAIRVNVDKSEMFYWTDVDKNSEVSRLMAQELAAYYQSDRNYDKAFLFYKELLQKEPDNVTYLLAYAETEVCRGKEKEALRTYEQILRLDSDNLTANIFVGNYFYLQAEQEKKRLDQDYKKIGTPTKMQYARYRDGLSAIFETGYEKAKAYLQNVVRQFPSTEANKTLDKIKLIEKEINK